jgi:hypothetical protein
MKEETSGWAFYSLCSAKVPTPPSLSQSVRDPLKGKKQVESSSSSSSSSKDEDEDDDDDDE